MRLSVALLMIAAAGMVGGAYLIGWWVVGLVVIAESAGLAVFALFRDDGRPAPAELRPVDDILNRYRQAK